MTLGVREEEEFVIRELPPEEAEEIVEEVGEKEEVPFINSQTPVIQVSGRLGIGKTWTLVAELFSACLALKLKRIITNVKILRLPDRLLQEMPQGVEVFYTTDIREVFKKLEDGIPTALAVDELSKSVNSRLAKSTFNLVMVRLLGDVRKSGVRFFIYSHQARKESDTLVRANNSMILYPRHVVNFRGYPIYDTWRDNEQFELDFKRGIDDYRYNIQMEATFHLSEIDCCYDTFERIPLSLNPGLTESEVPQAVEDFMKFCREKNIALSGAKATLVKMYLKRWNDNTQSHYVPYTPKALEVLLTELFARGILDKVEEKL